MIIENFKTKCMNEKRVRIRKSRYPNRNLALEIIGESGTLVATVNPPDYKKPHGSLKLDDGLVGIKTWAENEGVEEALVAAEVIEQHPVQWIPSGYVRIPIYRLTAKATAALNGPQS